MNKTLKEVLKLQDSAQDAEVIGAVNRLIENNDRLTREIRNSEMLQRVRSPSTRRSGSPRRFASWMQPLPTEGSIPQARRLI